LDNAPINSTIDLEGDNISSKFVPRYDDLDLVQPRYPHVTHLNKGVYLGNFFYHEVYFDPLRIPTIMIYLGELDTCHLGAPYITHNMSRL
jgi:hypothetical protein